MKSINKIEMIMDHFQGALSTGTNQNAHNQREKRNVTYTLSLSGGE